MSVTLELESTPSPTRRKQGAKPLPLADYRTPDQQAALLAELQGLVKRRKRIEISLRNVERLSLGNLELLVALARETRDAGKTLKLTAVEPSLENQLGLIGAIGLISKDANL